MYIIKPELRHITLRATFTTPVSHHDPAQKDRANISAFLRRKQVVDRNHAHIPDAETVARIVSSFPVPVELVEFFNELSTTEFLAAAIAKTFIAAYRSGDGVGLFSGIERYRRLQERIAFHAVRSNSMYQFWGGLTTDLQVGLPIGSAHDAYLTLLGMPSALALRVLAELSENSISAVMLGRVWADAQRNDVETATLTLAEVEFSESTQSVVEIPAFSANSARHELLREPGAIHLLNALGLRFEDLDTGAAMLLYNGGDLTEAAPATAFKLARDVREAYPLLGLLGGSTKGFILGSSNVEVSAWLVCKENAVPLERLGVTPELSAFDLLDREELTRHTAKRVDGTPMPFGFETLVTGAQVVVDMRLRPYATQLEAGALAAALATAVDADSTLGGQSARGYGLYVAEWLHAPATLDRDRDAYEAYLQQNADSLRDGLLSGTLTTGKALV